MENPELLEQLKPKAEDEAAGAKGKVEEPRDLQAALQLQPMTSNPLPPALIQHH